jgi:hypothetical protein
MYQLNLFVRIHARATQIQVLKPKLKIKFLIPFWLVTPAVRAALDANGAMVE